ncbi:MAG: BON domain-containing protein [Candidatus Sericytochromatia bacterium]|nr:BON domain-containing protein [Candidatus Sericytochromatia bacterium]
MRVGHGLLFVLLVTTALPAFAQAPPAALPAKPQQGQQARASFRIGDREVFQLAPAGGMTAEERARASRSALMSALTPETGKSIVRPFNLPGDVTTRVANNQQVVLFRGKQIASVTPPDVQASGMSAEALADRWARNLRDGLAGLNVDERTAYSAIRDAFTVAAAGAPTGETTGTGGGGPDDQLASRIRDRLRYDRRLSKQKVIIDVRRGEVTVRGTVPDQQTEDQILDTVRNTEGVNQVRSDLRIQGR